MNDVVISEMKSLLGDREVNRRAFVVSSLGAGFALAVLPVTAQTITTSAEGLVAGEVNVPTKDGMMPAYRAMPATGGNFPVVLVIQEIFGVHEHIKDVCRRIAKGGFFAIAPELYARQGDPAKYTDIPKLMTEIVSKVTDAQVMADLDATVAYAKSTGKADTARLGITGFCWGGRTVQMYAAHNPNVRAALLTTSLTRLRKETPSLFLVLVKEWLHPARKKMWSNGIQALVPLITSPEFDNLLR